MFERCQLTSNIQMIQINIHLKNIFRGLADKKLTKCKNSNSINFHQCDSKINEKYAGKTTSMLQNLKKIEKKIRLYSF